MSIFKAPVILGAFFVRIYNEIGTEIFGNSRIVEILII